MDEIHEMMVDPVCGEEVGPDECQYRAKFRGETYYFCCLNCQLDFEEDPIRYVGPFEGMKIDRFDAV